MQILPDESKRTGREHLTTNVRTWPTLGPDGAGRMPATAMTSGGTQRITGYRDSSSTFFFRAASWSCFLSSALDRVGSGRLPAWRPRAGLLEFLAEGGISRGFAVAPGQEEHPREGTDPAGYPEHVRHDGALTHWGSARRTGHRREVRVTDRARPCQRSWSSPTIQGSHRIHTTIRSTRQIRHWIRSPIRDSQACFQEIGEMPTSIGRRVHGHPGNVAAHARRSGRARYGPARRLQRQECCRGNRRETLRPYRSNRTKPFGQAKTFQRIMISPSRCILSGIIGRFLASRLADRDVEGDSGSGRSRSLGPDGLARAPLSAASDRMTARGRCRPRSVRSQGIKIMPAKRRPGRRGSWWVGLGVVAALAAAGWLVISARSAKPPALDGCDPDPGGRGAMGRGGGPARDAGSTPIRATGRPA